jgi:hypothetical protein
VEVGEVQDADGLAGIEAGQTYVAVGDVEPAGLPIAGIDKGSSEE